MAEQIVETLPAKSKVIETWWVDHLDGEHPTSFGGDEQLCRKHQAKHGGRLTLYRVYETAMLQIVEVTDD